VRTVTSPILRKLLRFAVSLCMGVGLAQTASATVIEDFESGNLSAYTVVGSQATATVSPSYAHDGIYGLGTGQSVQAEWYYRNDAGAHVLQGENISYWVNFLGAADGRAYLGFGASSQGTYCLTLAPNSNTLILESDFNYGSSFSDLATVSQTFQANHWYRAEVDWSVGGGMTGKLYDSDGTTLLNSVTASNNFWTSGGIALRGFSTSGGTRAIDTITAVPEPTPSLCLLFGSGFLLSRRRIR